MFITGLGWSVIAFMPLAAITAFAILEAMARRPFPEHRYGQRTIAFIAALSVLSVFLPAIAALTFIAPEFRASYCLGSYTGYIALVPILFGSVRKFLASSAQERLEDHLDE